MPIVASLLDDGRTHTCNALRRTDTGAQVVLFGWVHRRRDHGGRIFVDLRDRDGLTQVVFGPDIDAAAHALGDELRSEFCVGVAGTVVDRGTNEPRPRPSPSRTTTGSTRTRPCA
jgi:aspartyl-tRNA synthetase